jgi:hypothetical protein
MKPPVHMIGTKPFRLRRDREVTTRCGLHVIVSGSLGATYMLSNEAGGDLRGTTLETSVTCRKCRNLIDKGTLHGHKQRRTAPLSTAGSRHVHR